MQDTMSLSLGHLMDRVSADTKVPPSTHHAPVSLRVCPCLDVVYAVVTVFRRNRIERRFACYSDFWAPSCVVATGVI